MKNTISNMDDVIDSRDVIERIEYLQSERDDFDGDDWEYSNPDEAEELSALESLQEEAEGYCQDWEYGAQLIRDSYFKDYAQELAEDGGMLENCNQWPATCIDWEKLRVSCNMTIQPLISMGLLIGLDKGNRSWKH